MVGGCHVELATEAWAVEGTFRTDDLRRFGGEEHVTEMAHDLRAGNAVR